MTALNTPRFMTTPVLTPSYLPSLGQEGFYSLRSPYSKLINPTVMYKCLGTMSLQGYINQGKNPLQDIYLANGDTEENYNTDIAANASIVTISSGDLQVEFPNSALLAVPYSDGIVYRNMVLSIALSALPEETDVTTLQDAVSSMVKDRIGVASNTFVTVFGKASILTPEQDAYITAARNKLKQSPSNVYQRVVDLETQNTALLAKIAELENYIVSQQH